MMKQRKSNATVEQLQLLEHWETPVLVLIKDDIPAIDGVVEIYLTTESMEERIKAIENTEGYSYARNNIIGMVDAVLHNECDGLEIHGLTPHTIYISKEDLLEMEDEVDSITQLLLLKAGRITVKQAFSIFMKKTLFIQGRIPTEMEAEDEEFFFDTAKQKDGSEEAIKLYITEGSAMINNPKKYPIRAYHVSDVVSYVKGNYGIVIEPEQGIHFGVSKEKVKKFVD